MEEHTRNKFYDMLQEKVEKLQEKIDFLKDTIIDLERKQMHLCMIRDENDTAEQIRMLNNFKKVECKSENYATKNLIKKKLELNLQ